MSTHTMAMLRKTYPSMNAHKPKDWTVRLQEYGSEESIGGYHSVQLYARFKKEIKPLMKEQFPDCRVIAFFERTNN